MRQGVLNGYRASVVFWLMVLLVRRRVCHRLPDLRRTALAADEPAAARARPTSAAGDAAADDEAAAMQESYLVWFYKALGFKYVVIFLAISFTFVAFFVMNLLVSRRDNICPLHLVEAFEAHLNEKRYQEAYELAKADESMLGQVLASGLAKLSTGYDNALAAMQETGQEESLKLDQRLSVPGADRHRSLRCSACWARSMGWSPRSRSSPAAARRPSRPSWLRVFRWPW